MAVTLADCLLRFLVMYKATALLDFNIVIWRTKAALPFHHSQTLREVFPQPHICRCPISASRVQKLGYIIRAIQYQGCIYADIIFFASVWRFTKAEVRDMREAVWDYSKGVGNFANSDGVVTYPTEW